MEGLTSDHVVIDTSTVDPQTTRSLAARVGECGAAYLDCPILGRPSAAGKWMLPTGGSEEALEKVKPVLLCFAANAVLVGGSGAGNALKLLNQMMFSCINAISSEVMVSPSCCRLWFSRMRVSLPMPMRRIKNSALLLLSSKLMEAAVARFSSSTR